MTDISFEVEYDREMLRRGLLSLFWVAITRRRKKGAFTFAELAHRIKRGKPQVSRWFSSGDPNWQLNTIADLAHALGLRIEVRAVDIETGEIITPAGPMPAIQTTTYEPRPPVPSPTGAPMDGSPASIIA